MRRGSRSLRLASDPEPEVSVSGRATRHVHACAADQGSRVLPLLAPVRRLCLACAERRPRFRFRGVVKTDADHTLCFRCYRAQLQRSRASLMAAAYARWS